MAEFKHHDQLVKDNPNGLDTLETPHNFSSNPGFMSTAGMLGASTPAGGGVISGSSARGSVRPVANPIRSQNFHLGGGGGSRPIGNPPARTAGFNRG